MAGKHIGIIGAGTAGLHLGLYLRQHGISATILTDRRPEEYRSMRLLNTVAHHAVTLDRETALGIDHWPAEEYGYAGHYYYIGTRPTALQFYGAYHAPSRAVDYRIYQPQLMQDFVARGGTIDFRQIKAGDMAEIRRRFDLLVVCTGKGPFGKIFGRDDACSPYDKPQRALCVGLFKGIRETPKRAVTMYFAPGAGEIIEIPTLTFGGMATALVIENVIGGDLEILAKAKYDDDRRAFLDLLRDKLGKHYPTLADRIDQRTFDLADGPLDLLQGGVTPTIRHSHMTVGDGKIAIALGDVHATVDPLLGQGANLASHAAWILGEEIVRHEVFDERFAEHVNARRMDRVLSASRWSNFMLENLKSMPDMLKDFISRVSLDRGLSDTFTDNFNYPERQWDCFASPARMDAWCRANGAGASKKDTFEEAA